MLWQEWWVWIVAGVALAVLEVLAPAYVFLGFAIGAVVVGLGLSVGLINAGWPVLVLIFALISLGAWLALRRIFGLRKGQIKLWDRDINED